MPRRLAVPVAAGVLLAGPGLLSDAAAAPDQAPHQAPHRAAARANEITRLSVHYEVRGDGILDVTETIDYTAEHFQLKSGRITAIRLIFDATAWRPLMGAGDRVRSRAPGPDLQDLREKREYGDR